MGKLFFVLLVSLSLYGEEIWHTHLLSHLMKKIEEYQSYDQEKMWYVHDVNSTFRRGDKSPLIRELKSQLIREGDMDIHSTDEHSGDMFDQKLVDGLISYQKRHGLKATGKLDESTRNELSVPLSQRLVVMMQNKERLRTVQPARNGWIVVNIPSATLQLVENNQTLLSMKTVVGKPDRQTPLFDRRVVHSVVINPTWTMPQTIIREDMVKKIAKNPHLFEDNNITIFHGKKEIDPLSVEWKSFKGDDFLRYRYVQNSGLRNPLGKVKFLFSNTQSIYLHDTTRHDLFKNRERFESSGCIRLEKPQLLKEYILGKEFISPEGNEVVLPVLKPLKVSVIYLTAWVDKKGRVNYRNDVYHKDTHTDKHMSDSVTR